MKADELRNISVRARASSKGSFSTFVAHLREMERTHSQKNHDYSGSRGQYYNFEFAAFLQDQFNRPVDKVFAAILGIKLARIAVLREPGNQPKNEPVADSLGDLTTYAGIWWSYIEEEHDG